MRLKAKQKQELLELFDQSQEAGVTQERSGRMLGLERHRLSRWRHRRVQGALQDALSGPRQAPHRLLLEEQKAFLELATREDLADASVPVLCSYGSDMDLVSVSPSVFTKDDLSSFSLLAEAL